jgi:leucyl-tRNA synthetase
LFDSGEFNGLTSKEAKDKITEKLVKNGKGKKEVNYKFRDWVFSRQRYWGEPFPFEYIKEDKQKVLTEKEKTKYLIFDFDGVLGDTLEAFVRVAKEKLSPESSVEDIRQKWFVGHHEEAKYRRGGNYTTEEARDTLQKRRELGEWAMESGFAMFDEFIEEIKKIKNTKLAVVSSGSENYVKVYCERIGLPFTHVLGSETDLSKENKVESVAEDWGVSPKEIYFFTDTKSDVLELWDNLDNSKIFGCSWGWHGKERLGEVLPEDQILTSFDQIHGIFEKEKYTEIDGDFYRIKLLPEKDLPLVLPEVEDYQPSKDGRSPLIKTDWINILNEDGEKTGKREADTMPNWAGSSWYYLRYIDPKNPEEFADKQKLKYWLPVDHYFGGSEHTTLHLLYSRFWHRFLFDKGYVPTPEPYDRRTNGGILLAEDGTKMSKSKGNVINPDEKLELAGSDALRLYISFIGPYDTTVCWQEGGLKACKRLVDSIWSYRKKVDSTVSADKTLLSSYHKMVKKITEYSEEMKNNVAVAEIMTFSNLLKDVESIPVDIWKGFLQVVAPFAPHITEELWYEINDFDKTDSSKSIHLTKWPEFNSALCVDDTVTIAVQVNGKLRGTFEIAKDSEEELVLNAAKLTAEKYLEGKDVKFSKVVPNKLVTFAVK